MLIKIHKSYRDVVALCDKELLGKKLEEGIKQLDVKESFYNGEEVSEEQALKMLKFHAYEDATFNIAGNKAVSIAIKAGIINKDSIGEIGGIKFALVLA